MIAKDLRELTGAHAHIGLAFALVTFIPGLFWGGIFARTYSLLAVSVSHFMIGGCTSKRTRRRAYRLAGP